MFKFKAQNLNSQKTSLNVLYTPVFRDKNSKFPVTVIYKSTFYNKHMHGYLSS